MILKFSSTVKINFNINISKLSFKRSFTNENVKKIEMYNLIYTFNLLDAIILEV